MILNALRGRPPLYCTPTCPPEGVGSFTQLLLLALPESPHAIRGCKAKVLSLNDLRLPDLIYRRLPTVIVLNLDRGP